jgi:hypothetical protein
VTRWTVLIAAVCCTALAIFLPWAHYGGIDVALHRFPAWYIYVAAALVMHGCSALRPLAWRVAGGIASLVAGLMVVLLWLRYDDATVLFDSPVIPAVVPRPGLGPLFALAGVVLSVVLLIRRS